MGRAAHLGRLVEARNAVHAELALNPGFNIRRFPRQRL